MAVSKTFVFLFALLVSSSLAQESSSPEPGPEDDASTSAGPSQPPSQSPSQSPSQPPSQRPPHPPPNRPPNRPPNGPPNRPPNGSPNGPPNRPPNGSPNGPPHSPPHSSSSPSLNDFFLQDFNAFWPNHSPTGFLESGPRHKRSAEHNVAEVEQHGRQKRNVVHCNFFTQGGFTCTGCHTARRCYPFLNMGVTQTCSGFLPYCRNGFCSTIRGSLCTTTTTTTTSTSTTSGGST